MRRTWTLLGLMVLLETLVTGCTGEGTWTLYTWGEDYIEEGIPADAFADGCAVKYDTFLVVFSDRELRDADGATVGALEEAQVFDLALKGPHLQGEVLVPATHYDDVHVAVAPVLHATAGNVTQEQVDGLIDSGSSIDVAGTLTCGEESVSFHWQFDTATTYRCEPEDLTIPAGGSDATELTIHGDHLWYDGLENPDAELRGQAVLEADADGDGDVTLAELAGVSVSSLGYDVGRYGDVTDLAAFVAFLSRTLGHVDGEGHCQIDL